jgi:flagellar biogenesis protein FliO
LPPLSVGVVVVLSLVALLVLILLIGALVYVFRYRNVHKTTTASAVNNYSNAAVEMVSANVRLLLNSLSH